MNHFLVTYRLSGEFAIESVYGFTFADVEQHTLNLFPGCEVLNILKI